jgi:NRAMP (natural resistance-associated macrophage protein)-like metal ion transporter
MSSTTNREGTTSVLSRLRFRSFFIYLAAAGPGLIAANAGNDAGGVATYASAGAQFGYKPLFFMVLVTVGYVCIQEMVARLAAHTGKGLAALIREQFSLRLSAFAVLAFAVANVGLVVTEFAGIGTAFELFGVSRYLSVPIAAIAIWMLVIVGSYRYAERVFLLLSLAFISYPIAMILGHPDWKAVASNTLIPHVIGSKAFLLVAVALIGTTITPYIQLYTAGAVVDRGIGPDEYKYERVDAVSGAVVSDIVSMCIIIATAAAIGGTGALSSAADAAKALAPVAGRFSEYLFGIGLLGASALAAAVVPLSTSYAVAEAVGVERSVSKTFRQAPLFLGLFTAQLLIGAGVVLLPGNLFALIVNTQVLEGVVTPVTLVFVLVLANRRALLGAAANGHLARTVGLITVVVVGGFASLLVLITLAGWLGLSF